MKTNNILVKPVKKYAPPKYPTRIDAVRAPELLRKLPSRWEKNAAVITAAGLFGAMTLTSCGLANPAANTGELAGDVIMEIPSEQEVTRADDEIIESFILMGEPAPVEFTSEQEATSNIDEATDEAFMLMGAPVLTEFTSEQDYICETSEETTAGYLAGEIIMDIPSEQNYIDNDSPETSYVKSFFDTSYIPPVPGGTGPSIYMSEGDVPLIVKGMAETYGLNFEELQPATDDIQNWSLYTRKLYDAEKKVVIEYSGALGYSDREPYVSSEGIIVGTFDIDKYYDEYDIVDNEFWQKVDEITFDKDSNEYQAKYDELFAEYESKIQVLAEENLRARICDFIEWLQGQGII